MVLIINLCDKILSGELDFGMVRAGGWYCCKALPLWSSLGPPDPP